MIFFVQEKTLLHFFDDTFLVECRKFLDEIFKKIVP